MWWGYKQPLQGRMYPFVVFSCLYSIWIITVGKLLIDSITISLFAVIIWLAASILWSESHHSILELFTWCSYFLIFSAARNVDTQFVMWMLMPNGIYLSIKQLIKQTRTDDAFIVFPLFGNGNHNAAFLITALFASIWLAVNVYPYIFILSAIMSLAIVRTKCRGATLGMAVGIVVMMCAYEREMIYYSLFLFVVFIIASSKRFINGWYHDRISIYRDVIKRIHPRWLIGRGLNYFRGETYYGRVHNDFLEIVGEIGLVGFLLFAFIFTQLTYSPIILGCFVAFMIHSMFFYPLREIHTALPFWAIMGTSALPNSNALAMPVLKISSILSILFIIIFTFTVFYNLATYKKR